ncbi:hypothetical protein AGDE_12807 [Angomonas deanei]|uniref:REH2 DRSM domain-containing protein n=1 Tax=Angomonas deanei TaxID=59799 RepID=A0A7G2CJ42_9TRYP|nr:hypothetical protein AGDE_12807 [Angomonas deanei]CAD2218954.1 hypothetical protein, conserved [Angomonas deanei]|eukprot:EPY23447.1 hypothetical protein AGDE_12807 [Angomonas deanei]
MHAEAALDSAGIPLFLSSERQARRVEEAKGTGRYVPSLGDYPKSFEDIVVPPPVRIGAEEAEGKSTAVAPDKVAVPEAEVTLTYVTVEEPSTTDGTMEKVEYVIPEDVIESLPVARQPSVKRCFPFDVTEGGLYDEVDFAEWLNHTYLPMPPFRV